MNISIILISFLNLIGLSNHTQPKAIEDPIPMVKFEGVDLKGNIINSALLENKIVVFNFMYVGCKPCMAELPALNKLYDDYSDKGVVFIAVNRSTKKLIINKLVKKNALKYTTIPDALEICNKFGVHGFPTNMVFDKNGHRKFYFEGGLIGEHAKTAIYAQIAPVLDKMLKEEASK